MAGLLRPFAGQVTIDGKPVNYRQPFRAARAGIQLVPSDRCLFTSLSVADNISFGRRGQAALDEALDYFLSWRNGCGSRPGRCPAASSRCSCSPAPWWRRPG